MKRLAWVILILFALLIFGCGREKEPSAHKNQREEVKKEVKVEEKKAEKPDMEMKGLTMESIQKEGKVEEIAPGTVQISPQRQQFIGVKIGTAEMKSLEKVIRTVGRVDYDEKRIVTVSPKIGGWIEDLYVDFTGKFVKKGIPFSPSTARIWSLPKRNISLPFGRRKI